MKDRISVWTEASNWMKDMDALLPRLLPMELPEPSTPHYWSQAAWIELSRRCSISASVRDLIHGHEPTSMTRLEAWFYRRRVEWAVELLSANATARTEPEIPLARVLEWLLISSWESDGCIEFQRKARRGGKEHPSNWESVVVLAAARGENFQPGPTGPTRGNRSVGGTVTA